MTETQQLKLEEALLNLMDVFAEHLAEDLPFMSVGINLRISPDYVLEIKTLYHPYSDTEK